MSCLQNLRSIVRLRLVTQQSGLVWNNTPSRVLHSTIQALTTSHAQLSTSTTHRSPANDVNSNPDGFRQSPSSEAANESLFDSWDSNKPIIPREERYFTSTSQPPPPTSDELPPRLGPTAGRSVSVRGGDVAGALMQLRRICNENSIARDSSLQRFYERPGLKKKRLRRERFRRRFKESFKRMVNTVMEMKRQGI